MLRIILVVLFVLGLLLINYTPGAFAQGQEGKEDNEWSPVSAGPVTTWTAPLCGKGKLVVQPFFFYNRTRGTFNSEGHYNSLPKADKRHQYQQQLFLQYGLTDRIEIDGQIVYQENYIKQDGLKAHANGLGDSYLFLRYCGVEEKSYLPHITGLFQLKLPTGKYEHADPNKLGTDLMGATSGGGSWDHGYGMFLSKKLRPFLFHADAIYSFPQKVRVDGVKTIYSKYFNYDFGAEYFLPKGFNIMLEFNGFLQGDKKQDGERVPASDIRYFVVAPGIGWSCGKIQTLLVYQRTLTGTSADANDSVVLTFVYTF